LATSARFRLVPTFFFDDAAAETPSAGTPSAGVPELFFFAMRSHGTALDRGNVLAKELFLAGQREALGFELGKVSLLD
jgi:hypothetical protein